MAARLAARGPCDAAPLATPRLTPLLHRHGARSGGRRPGRATTPRTAALPSRPTSRAAGQVGAEHVLAALALASPPSRAGQRGAAWRCRAAASTTTNSTRERDADPADVGVLAIDRAPAPTRNRRTGRGGRTGSRRASARAAPRRREKIRSPVKRQMMIALAKPSIAESRPKPISAIGAGERCRRAIATAPSTVIQPRLTPGQQPHPARRAARSSRRSVAARRSRPAVAIGSSRTRHARDLGGERPHRAARARARSARTCTILPSRRERDEAGGPQQPGRDGRRASPTRPHDPGEVADAQLARRPAARRRPTGASGRRAPSRPAGRAVAAAPSGGRRPRGRARPWAGRGRAGRRCRARPRSHSNARANVGMACHVPCGRGDSNSHGSPHRILSPARLPVPPRPRPRGA